MAADGQPVAVAILACSELYGSWEVTAMNFTITQHLPAKNFTAPYKHGFNLALSLTCNVLSGEFWGLFELPSSSRHCSARPGSKSRDLVPLPPIKYSFSL